MIKTENLIKTVDIIEISVLGHFALSNKRAMLVNYGSSGRHFFSSQKKKSTD